MSGDISGVFVATYYRTLYAQPQNMSKFYDSQARLRRGSTTFQFDPSANLLPFDPDSITARIYTVNSQTIAGGFMVSVHGCLSRDSDVSFTQQFVLIQQGSRWFICVDNFFDFSGSLPVVIGAEAAAIEPIISRPPPQQASVTPFYRPAAPVGRTRIHSELREFDPDKTITILNLSDNYSHDEVAGFFLEVGTLVIERQYATYNAMYIQFETPEMTVTALERPQITYQDSVLTVSKGIHVIEQKNVHRLNRSNPTKS
jgi:hypothetical protein